MNVEHINQVADAIEQHTIPWLGFNMSSYKANKYADRSNHDCGTTACIAGWANAIRLGLTENTPDEYGWCRHTGAALWLGLSENQADDLFYARNHPDYWENGYAAWDTISADQAVRTLRHLAKTGEVDWEV